MFQGLLFLFLLCYYKFIAVKIIVEKRGTMRQSIFQKRKAVYILATLAAATWACAFPLIKTGFQEFAITGTDTWGKTLFAGIRFFIAGLVVLLVARMTKRSFAIKTSQNAALLILFSLVNTTFHYFFFYIGLSNMTGSRSSIIDSMGTFLLVILACVCFKDEHLTKQKIAGCLLGFSGILLININGGLGSAVTFGGDGMLVLSALSAAFGGILTRIVTKKIDAVFATGVSLSLGGVALIACGAIMGGRLSQVTAKGILIIVLLILVSAVGFVLYNQLISYHPVGEIAIFNSFIPVMGTLLSCLFLGEPFLTHYFLAGGLVVLGVYVVNKKRKA